MFSFTSTTPESVALEIASLVEKFTNEREQLRFEKKQWEAQQRLVQQNKLKSVEDIVTLNVGGELYTTSKNSLINPLYSLTALNTMQEDEEKKKKKKKKKQPELPLIEEEHFFSTLFSERFDVVTDKEGRIFIDRDGTNFRYILNYLRCSGDIRKCGLPLEDEHLIAEIKQEAEFFGLRTLVRLLSNGGSIEDAYAEEQDELEAIKEMEKAALGGVELDDEEDEEEEGEKKKGKKKMEDDSATEEEEETEEGTEDDESPASESEEPVKKKGKKKAEPKINLPIPSVILAKKSKLGKKHVKTINQWVLDKTAKKKATFKLLYRGSRDGFNAASFHSKVDGKGATVSIMYSGGCIFGGFASVAFNSVNNYVFDGNAFLFNVERSGTKKATNEKYDVMAGCESLYDYPTNGPSFADDLMITDNFDQAGTCSCYLGSCYNTGAFNSLATSNTFALEEVEVFLIK